MLALFSAFELSESRSIWRRRRTPRKVWHNDCAFCESRRRQVYHQLCREEGCLFISTAVKATRCLQIELCYASLFPSLAFIIHARASSASRASRCCHQPPTRSMVAMHQRSAVTRPSHHHPCLTTDWPSQRIVCENTQSYRLKQERSVSPSGSHTRDTLCHESVVSAKGIVEPHPQRMLFTLLRSPSRYRRQKIPASRLEMVSFIAIEM